MRRNARKNGFTLVEIIVVLVILAILAALLIPAMIRWIEKAEEKSAVVEARTCLTAIQSIAVERYAAKAKYNLANDEEETLELAEAPDGADIQQALVSDTATVTKMVYKTAKDVIVTYENGIFSLSSIVHSLGNTGDLDAIKDAMNSAFNPKKNTKTLNSNASNLEGTETRAAMDALQAAGLDVASLGAATWQYRKSGLFYWTPEDITGLDAGTKVPVMRYNYNSGTFTVWEVEVYQNQYLLPDGTKTTFKALRENGPETQITPKTLKAEEQTYEQMLEDYNKAKAGD